MKTIKIYLSVILTSSILLISTSCTNTSAQNGKIKNDPISDTVVKTKPPVNQEGMTLKTRFNTPEGFTRVNSKENSFGSYLQNLPLLSYGSQVKHFDGRLTCHSKEILITSVLML